MTSRNLIAVKTLNQSFKTIMIRCDERERWWHYLFWLLTFIPFIDLAFSGSGLFGKSWFCKCQNKWRCKAITKGWWHGVAFGLLDKQWKNVWIILAALLIGVRVPTSNAQPPKTWICGEDFNVDSEGHDDHDGNDYLWTCLYSGVCTGPFVLSLVSYYHNHGLVSRINSQNKQN